MPATAGRRRMMKFRSGGVLSRVGGAERKFTLTEQAALDGEPLAFRALLMQAMGENVIDQTHREFRELTFRAAPNGTGGEKLTFTGYASVTERAYTMCDMFGAFDEIMHQGFCTRTLGNQPDTVFVLNHNWDMLPYARTAGQRGVNGTLTLTEDDTGLLNEGTLAGERSDVRDLRSAIDNAEIDAMSMAFWVTQQTWSPDYLQRDIHEIDIDGGDTSVVTFPANPGTGGTISMRRRQLLSLGRTDVPALIVKRARAERRAAGELTEGTRAVLQTCLDLAALADTAVDWIQPLLAEILGVENPDDAQDAGMGDDGDGGADTDADSATGGAPGLMASMSLSRLRVAEDRARRGR
jgi:uncharacterized protein